MIILKTIRMFGDDWAVELSEKSNDDGSSSSSFNSGVKKMVIHKDHMEMGLFHELLEAVLVKNLYRYYGQEGSMEYIFHFDHSGLTRIAEQLAIIFKDNNLLK